MKINYHWKKFLTFLFFLFLSVFCFAETQMYWDYGELEMNFLIGKETSGNAGIECFDFMFIEEKTGLYTSFCPIRIEFKNIDEDKSNKKQTEPWSSCVFNFVNANAGWITSLTDFLALEIFVNCSTLNPFDIKHISFRTGLELSVLTDVLDFGKGGFPCIGKIASYEMGMFLSSRAWNEPKLYFAIDFNFSGFMVCNSCIQGS